MRWMMMISCYHRPQHVLLSCWCASLVGGSGCLPGSCLSIASTIPSHPLFYSSSHFFLLPTPAFPSPSFRCILNGCGTQRLHLCKVDGGGGLVVPIITHWGGTLEPLIHGIRGCGDGA